MELLKMNGMYCNYSSHQRCARNISLGFILLLVLLASRLSHGSTAIVVDSSGDVGKYSSIALDRYNNPHISYYDETNTGMKYASKGIGGWGRDQVDSVGDVGFYPDIATDDFLGYPYISYYDQGNGYLKLAYKDEPGPFKIELCCAADIVVTNATSIAINSMAIQPIIAYVDSSVSKLKLAIFDRGDSLGPAIAPNGWGNETVAATGTMVEDVSLVLSPAGEPHIAYIDVGSTGQGVLMYARKQCLGAGCLTQVTPAMPTGEGVWSVDVVDSSANIGKSAAIAFGAPGNIHIAYYNQQAGDLKYASKAVSGTVWTIETVDSVGDVGNYVSIDVDANDQPHISYYDITNGALKYATRAPGSATWTVSTLDSDGDVGLYTDIAVDFNGRPHISYYDASNKDLKYAYLCSTCPDLVESMVSNPPDSVRRGRSYTLTIADTVRNIGGSVANPSISRYFLSKTGNLVQGGINLVSRSVPSLAPNQNSSGTLTRRVTIPSRLPLGRYYLVACADSSRMVMEADEGNNCLASSGTVNVKSWWSWLPGWPWW